MGFRVKGQELRLKSKEFRGWSSEVGVRELRFGV